MTDCLFCGIINGKIPSDLIYEDKEMIAFKDINPQAPTHILIVPRRHIQSLSEMTEADKGLTGNLLFAARKIAQDQGISNEGYRVVVNNGQNGGQTVFHLHLHLMGGRPMAWPPG